MNIRTNTVTALVCFTLASCGNGTQDPNSVTEKISSENSDIPTVDLSDSGSNSITSNQTSAYGEVELGSALATELPNDLVPGTSAIENNSLTTTGIDGNTVASPNPNELIPPYSPPVVSQENNETDEIHEAFSPTKTEEVEPEAPDVGATKESESESAPVEPTPEEPTPVEPTLEESTPEEPTPEESTPEESTLEEPTPEKPTASEPTPAELAAAEPTPEEPTPEEPTPEEPTPEEPTLEEPTPEEPTPEEPTPEEPTPVEPSPAEPTAQGTSVEESEPPRTITIGSHSGDVTKILDKHVVSTSQLMVQQTPVDTHNGYVYTANIEHGVNGDSNDISLKTVVRQGTQNTNGSWTWVSKLIEDRTVYDQWHTAPSVATDNAGYIHVTYNMHNFPWQYKVSTSPNSLDDFEFRGQSISDAELNRSKFENKTTFPTLGQADIPGNQITYPAFFKDRNQDLYISYRFAAKPKRSFEERTMSAGIAAYDTQLKSWSAIGGPISVQEGYDYDAHPDADTQPKSVASNTGWTVYHPRLTFGPENAMNVNLFFRQGIAGAELSRPCFIKSQDRFGFEDLSGTSVSVPLSAADCGNMGYPDEQQFYSIGNSAMDSGGNPHIVLSPHGDSRKIAKFDNANNAWNFEDSPGNATEIFFDAEDNLWAIATGIKVMVLANGSSTWTTVYEDPENASCFPKVTVNDSMDTAFIHTHACDQETITIYGLRLN